MARYLVVAHQTVTSPELLKAVRGLGDQDAKAEYVLLVPTTPVRHLLFRTGDENDAEGQRPQAWERASAVFTKRGVPLSEVRVGSADRRGDRQRGRGTRRLHRVCHLHLPAEKSRWLRLAWPARSRRSIGCPYTTFVAEPWGPGSESESETEMAKHNQFGPLVRPDLRSPDQPSAARQRTRTVPR